MNKIVFLLAAGLPLVAAAVDCRPETWFHVIGGNASKAGLTADLEALKDAGFGGIQFFHGQWGEAEAWDGVAEQIPCLSPKWDELVTYAADECARLGLSFKMQNCPGWSMSGGPWIAPSNAMRKLVYARRDVGGDMETHHLAVPDIAIPQEFRDADSDWKDVCYIAFPTPEGECGHAGRVTLPCGAANGDVRPLVVETNGNVRTFFFDEPVTIRTLELPSPSQLNHAWSYNPDTHVLFEAKTESGWKIVCDVDYPQGCWQDRVPFSVACGGCDDGGVVATHCEAATWRLTMTAPHPIKLPFVKLHSAARLDNWEGKAGHVLRGLGGRTSSSAGSDAYIPRSAIRVVNPGDVLSGCWTVLRVGHVNMKKQNAPAPKEATGWECDKLDPRGIEANFAGYIGRLVDGPLAGGKLNGMIVDSWECERQTWTWRMPEWYREANGYDVNTILPAVFGWILDSPAETEKILLDWRRTISNLITKNYYGRMSELAHAKGLSVVYETAFGDVVPGDILEYWKYCDTPMCEFWQPYALDRGGGGHPNFKPVRPCVSAAHLYGKRRVDCEAFTSMSLTWDENFRTLKEQAVRHFARGVTHLVFHTCTHNPQTDGRVPGTSFGSYIGTPFVRGQTWWPFMRSFTDWTANCCAFLERGKPVVDVLRYLGDELDHKPDELEYFPNGFKNDYLNADVLFNRLDVKGGCFVLPDGMSYAVVWVPDSVMVLPATRARLDALAAKGGRVVYGSADDAVRGMKPQIVSESPLLWYRRVDGAADCFFVAADEKGFKGEVTFRTQHGNRSLSLDLAPFENRLLEFWKNVEMCKCENMKAANTQCCKTFSYFHNSTFSQFHNSTLTNWVLSFPSGWGAPERIELDHLVPWKELPGVSEEGRAFSGTATYTANVELKMENGECGPGERACVTLDLGEVRDFARVFVNGREVATLWAEPYRCDIAPYAKKGVNEIRVEVTSTWFNRLAYDFRQPPGERRTWTVWNIGGRTPPCLLPSAEPRPSGLLGPVRLSTF